jgi:hypothetical protein
VTRPEFDTPQAIARALVWRQPICCEAQPDLITARARVTRLSGASGERYLLNPHFETPQGAGQPGSFIQLSTVARSILSSKISTENASAL